MEDLKEKYRLLTVEEVENLSLELRVCFFIQPWNNFANIKNVEDWLEIFWYYEAIKIVDRKYFQMLYNKNLKEEAKKSLRNEHERLLNWVSGLIKYHKGE